MQSTKANSGVKKGDLIIEVNRENVDSVKKFKNLIDQHQNGDGISLFVQRMYAGLMVYFAAGVSGFTGIIESFFVKEQLGLTAAFLASLGFWAGLPWALKMPLGHLVDLFWRRKSMFVYLGAALMAASLLIMVGLTGYTD